MILNASRTPSLQTANNPSFKTLTTLRTLIISPLPGTSNKALFLFHFHYLNHMNFSPMLAEGSRILETFAAHGATD